MEVGFCYDRRGEYVILLFPFLPPNQLYQFKFLAGAKDDEEYKLYLLAYKVENNGS
jgi:hypothetical protein